ncbi:MAG: TonB-dependent siderophore receptor [Proteobacteria bacterium]|nr:TonB-dependent siderophore receptor [Pseudomonadota bacterium]
MNIPRTAAALSLLTLTLPAYADEPPSAEFSKLTVKAAEESPYATASATTGTKTDTPLMETPLSVQVVPQQVLVDQQDIRIDQALRNVSGVAFTAGGDTSFGNAFDAVVVRGFQTDSHLRNGVRLDSFGSDSELFTQQLTNVESLEVLKGPAAILYGAVEPGGVVNVVTKQPQATSSFSVQQQIGSYDLYRTTLDATGPVTESVLYRVDASYDTSQSIVDLAFTRDLFFAPTLKVLLGDATQVTLEYEHKDSNFNGNYAISPLVQIPGGAFVPLYNDPHLNFGERSGLQERTDLGGINWSTALTENWMVRQQFLANLVHVTAPQVTSDGVGPLTAGDPNSPPAIYRVMAPLDNRDDLYASYLDFTGHMDTGPLRHTLLVGGDWYRFNSKYVLTISNPTFSPDPTLDSVIGVFDPVHPGTAFGPLQPYTAGTGPTVSWGVHLQDQVALGERLFLLVGARYQHVYEANYTGVTLDSLTPAPLTGSATTPRIGVVFRPETWVSLYANFAKNWGPSNGYPYVGGGLVPPTSANQKEIGVKFDLLAGRLTSTLAVYDLTKTNIPTPDPANPNVFLVTGKVRSRGLEFDLQGELLPGWNLIANFSDDDARITANNDPSNPPGTQWPQTPRLIANLWTTYEFTPAPRSSLKVGAGVNAQGRQPALNYTGVLATQTSDYTNIGGYATVNAMAAYRRKVGSYSLTAQVNISNLLNGRYFSYISLTDPQASNSYSYLGTQYNFDRRLYGDPRTVIGSLSLEF